MKDYNKTNFRVGLVSISALVILFLIIAWTKNISIFANTRSVQIHFSTAAGLEIGNHLTINGVRRGVVSKIEETESGVMVTCTLEDKAKIRDGAKFYLSMLDLMGGKKIEVLQGNGGDEIQYDQVQDGVFNTDIPAVMALVGTVGNDLPQMVVKINTTLDAINAYLQDEKLKTDLKESASNLAMLSKEMKLLIAENKSGIASLIHKTSQLSDQASELITDNSDGVKQVIQKADKLMVSADQLTQKIDSMVDETKSQKNNLGRLMYDEELFETLKKTLSELKGMTGIIKEQLNGKGLKVDADINLF